MAAISQVELKPAKWQTIVICTLAFWLSASFILDFVIMPSLYAAGMMTQPSFATAGYSLFWVFNRIELVCAALAVTGSLVLANTHPTPAGGTKNAIILSLILLAVTLIDTYGLSPNMSALGMQLNLFEPVDMPAAMIKMQASYWVLELIKLATATILLGWFFRKADSHA